jgi:hypothetical protein
MGSREKLAVRDVLRRFAEGRADIFAVVRALVEHESWVVPMETMLRHYGPFESTAFYVLGEQTTLPDGTLWVFTDLEAAMSGQAYGYVPGPCVAGIPGLTLFRNLPTTWKEVSVNVGSPVEETFYQQPHETLGYLAVTRVAKGIRIERALADCRPEKHAEFAELLRQHDEWWLIQLRDHTFFSAYSAGEGPPFLMVFTAPDRVQAAMNTMGTPGLFADARIVALAGSRLMNSRKRSGGYYGLMINSLDPEDGIVFPFSAGSEPEST